MQRWTPDQIVRAIHRWIALHGAQPTFNEWRSQEGYPRASTVQSVFGSWTAAMLAAGGTARTRGEYDRERQRVPWRNCPVCKRRFRKQRRFKYCSGSCRSIATSKAHRSDYKYRRTSQKLAHRDIAERWLGRRLRRTEVIHHIDGDGRNNRLSNLALLSVRSHALLHCHGGEVIALDGTRYCCEPSGSRPGKQPGPLVVSVAESVYAPANGRRAQGRG